MKRFISCLLLVTLLAGQLPISSKVSAAEALTNKEPVLLGTEAEYKSTLDTMFDENGLRKVMVGFNSTSFDELYAKYGLVDKNGNFVAQPVYDEIQFHTAYNDLIYGEGSNTTVLPTIFIGGYTQVVRDGKMGLMNTKGEEVIPCQYDFVSLPSEGMCRVLNRKDKSEWWYLGYWNLDKNK